MNVPERDRMVNTISPQFDKISKSGGVNEIAMENRFKVLMHRFREGTLTSLERREFLEMIERSDFDRKLGEEWFSLLDQNLSDREIDLAEHYNELEEIRRNIDLDPRMNHRRNGSQTYRKLIAISSAAAIGLVLVAVMFWWKGHTPIQFELAQSNETEVYHFSGKQYLRLPDGSTVILNEDSELSYDETFNNEIREVRLTGEAFFEVVPDSLRPFIVRTGDYKTRVLGTAFNVEAWPGQNEINVTVEKGKVSVGNEQEVFDELLPNEQLTIDKERKIFEKQALDPTEEIEWKKSFFVLDKVSMEEAMVRIGERYSVHVEIMNKKLGPCIVYGTFLEGESLEHVLSVLCLAMNADYNMDMETRRVKILGGIGCSE